MRSDARPLPRLLGLFGTGAGLVVDLVVAAAFWATVVFPLVYVGGYLATFALPSLSLPSVRVLGVLLAVNVLALVVGHRYDGDRAGSGPESDRTPAGGTRRGD